MKKFVNRLIATLIASSCMFSALAMDSNAILVDKVLSEEYLLENGYTKFDDHGMLYQRTSSNEVIGTYTDGESYYTLTRQKAHMYIMVPLEADTPAIRSMLYRKYKGESGAFAGGIVNGKDYQRIVISDFFNDLNLPEKARSMMNDVKAETEIYEFTYADSMEWLDEVMCLCEDITDYIYIEEEDVEKLQNFVEENNLDFTVEVSDIETLKRCHLIPNESVTIDEQFEVAARIRSELNLDSTEWMQMGGDYIGNDIKLDTNERVVDVLNSVDGDANEDGKVNMADVAAVVQAIGNPDKYALTPQGSFNADTDGDGITGMDALGIQMKVAEAGMPE